LGNSNDGGRGGPIAAHPNNTSGVIPSSSLPVGIFMQKRKIIRSSRGSRRESIQPVWDAGQLAWNQPPGNGRLVSEPRSLVIPNAAFFIAAEEISAISAVARQRMASRPT
jgi:hypothetical protein